MKSKAKQRYIDSFTDGRTGLVFHGAHAFCLRGRNLLLEAGGHILLLDDRLLEQILRQEIEEDLAVKLMQRNFASLGSEKRVMEPCVGIRPTFFMIDLTNRCNMCCRYCLRDSVDSPAGRVMSEETVRKVCDYIVQNCRAFGTDQIVVQPWGGEPLLEKEKIFMIQDRLAAQGIHAQLTIETNGLGLSEETIRQLSARDIAVSVSIDGYREIHDSQRVLAQGRSSHALVEGAIRRLQRYYGDNVSVIATITRQSADHVEQILDYFAKDLKLKNIKLNYVHQSSFHENSEMCMSPEEIQDCSERLLDKIVSLQEEGYPVSDYNLWIRTMNLLTDRKLDVCNSRGCTGGRNMVTFDTEGGIYPCDVTDYPKERLGGIEDGRLLTELVEAALPEGGYFAEKTAKECETCPWHVYCRGGCTVHAKCAGKQAGEIDAIECAVNRAVYPRLIDHILESPASINRLLDVRILA